MNSLPWGNVEKEKKEHDGRLEASCLATIMKSRNREITHSSGGLLNADPYKAHQNQFLTHLLWIVFQIRSKSILFIS